MGSWTTNTPLPYNVRAARAVEYNGKVYIVGGLASSGCLDTPIEYDPTGGGSYNTTLASLNTPRLYYAIGLHGSTIIAAGGYYNDSYLNSVEIYDIEDDAAGWSYVTSMPGEANSGLTGVVYGDYFYVFGGIFDKVYKCDINNNFSWTTPISDAGIGDHPTVEVVGDYIWVIGGNTDRTVVRKWDPNPSIDDWVTGESYTVAPSDVYYAASCVKGTKIYIAGGQGTAAIGQSTTISNLNDLRSFDTSIPTDPSAWDDTLDNMPTARYSAVGAKVDNSFYVMGGITWVSGQVTYFDNNESYELPDISGDINPYKTRVSQ